MKKRVVLQWRPAQASASSYADHLLEEHASETWAPNADVYEGPNELVLRIELAGVHAESIQVHVEGQSVYIRGNRPDPACRGGAGACRFRQLEIQYGPFQRVIQLSYPVNNARVRAVMRQGILEIRLPRTELARTKTVNVKIEKGH